MIYTIFRLPHKGLRQNPTESDMPDLSELSDYVGLCRIMSDFVGFCRILSDFVGFFVGFLSDAMSDFVGNVGDLCGGGPYLVLSKFINKEVDEYKFKFKYLCASIF